MGSSKNTMRYRLGLDLGTGSLGWAVLELDQDGKPFRIERLGSRIFGTGRKPKDDTSLAADRRQARSARRRRDRYIQRRNRLLKELADSGLFPRDRVERDELKKLNPFRLRYEGLRRELTPYELGRALFHLQQRRGFKSNRKTDKGADDTGSMKTAIASFREKLVSEGSDLGAKETVGSYLWQEIKNGRGARARHRKEGSKNIYDFYISRDMVEDEFFRLWEAQEKYHPGLLTEDARERVHYAIFDQRPLKPVNPGKCLFEPSERRASDALVSSQLFRLYQEVNSLRVRNRTGHSLIERPLTREERDKAIEYLRPKDKATFDSLKKHLFGKETQASFSHERGERTRINGDAASHQLSKKEAFGKAWWDLSLEEQDEVARRIDDVEGADSEHELGEWLVEVHGLSEDQAGFVVNEVSLPDGHRHLSALAINKILPHLIDGWNDDKDQALTYDQAVLAAGYRSHSVRGDGELYDRLPYYGVVLNHYCQDVAQGNDESARARTNPDELEYGRIANPSVHIGLNQVRLVVNALVERYGIPEEVHVEVARELGQGQEAKKEASKKRNDNEKRNEDLARKLSEDFGGQKNNYANRERLRLYEELGPLGHRCVFTGRTIERAKLFTNEYQVDHILPYSRTLDDSFNNKILIHFTANQKKGNQSPFEAYGGSAEWDSILARAKEAFDGNSPAKLFRFSDKAMEKFEGPDVDFIARQLNDTAYLSRATKEYLGSLVNPYRVRSLPGRLTGMLRAHWGLNSILSRTDKKAEVVVQPESPVGPAESTKSDDSDTGESGDNAVRKAAKVPKERSDHRHHAIDAAVIALIDQGTLKKVTEANKRATAKGRENAEGNQRLLEGFDQPWEGFHREVERKVAGIVVSHRPDHGVEGQLHEDTAYSVKDGPDKAGRYLTTKRETEGERTGKFEEPKWRSLIPIFRAGQSPDSDLPYKAYVGGSNYCIEIVRTASGRWAGEVISTFDANQPEYLAFMKDKKRFRRQSFSGQPLVMRLSSNDTIAIEDQGERRVMRLVKVSTAKQMYYAEHFEGNVDARNSDKDDCFQMLSINPGPLSTKWKARRVFVDPLGNVLDPGFRE